MKINRMWAVFNANDVLYSWTVRDTRREVINKIESDWGIKWPHLYRNGYRIEKVVVLRAAEFEELLAKQGGGRSLDNASEKR